MPTDPSLLGEAGEPCWMDVKTRDMGATGALLEAVLGWQILVDETDWRRATKAQLDGRWVAGLSDLANPVYPPDLPDHLAFYIAVDELDVVVDRAERLAGELLVEPFEAGDQGRIAVLRDPFGVGFSLWQRARREGWSATVESAGPTELRWYGREAAEAAHYYRNQLGLPLRSVSFLDDRPDAPSGWIVAVRVADVEAALDAAHSAGAVATRGPRKDGEVLLEMSAGLSIILVDHGDPAS